MKIALVNTMTPFVRGGAEILVDDLRGQLAERGHQVELFRLPFPNDYAVGLPELVLASKLLDFSSYDRVIAFKFPAYCVCHRHRRCGFSTSSGRSTTCLTSRTACPGQQKTRRCGS